MPIHIGMKKTIFGKVSCFIITLCLGLLACHTAIAGVDVLYRYALADFSGPIKTFQAKLAVSPKTNEVFVFDPSKKDIRVFNEHGMEIFKLGEQDEFARARDLAVDDEANVYILSPDLQRDIIAKYNFRGDPVGKINIRAIPPQFADINPSIIVFRQNRLYLVEVDT